MRDLDLPAAAAAFPAGVVLVLLLLLIAPPPLAGGASSAGEDPGRAAAAAAGSTTGISNGATAGIGDRAAAGAGKSSTGGMAVRGARAYVPGEVVVRFRGEGDRVVEVPRGLSEHQTAAALDRNPSVLYAAPNHIAEASVALPRDSGHLLREGRGPVRLPGPGAGDPAPIEVGASGGWTSQQWNFLPWRAGPRIPHSAGGIDAVGAWQNMRRLRRPGGQGAKVAVLDTGVAYRNFGRRYRRNPDFAARQFAPGYDFVRGNRYPLDRNGHGSHVAGTIAQRTGNGVGLTGIAYNARIIPVRVLDKKGNGNSDQIARGIRWAADRGAHVINMSFNFGCGDRVPNVAAAARYAYRRGVVLVASVGNSQTERCISAPATLQPVIGVGGTTEGGCLGEYSLGGPSLDLVAPGGGWPVSGYDCEQAGRRPIYQVTYARPGSSRRFGIPARYFGTSMAAAHVSGVAALIRAAGLLGTNSDPAGVKRRLLLTARPSTMMPRVPAIGAGILDAAAATDPRTARRLLSR